ncbi:MAG: hypothetical protein IM638_06170 [Bacteroidetes bacterium]|nr:hypothetical protein [Bacteroidota bacterium]
MKPFSLFAYMGMLLFVCSCKQEETPEPYSTGGTDRPMFLPVDMTGERYLLYQATDSLPGDSSFVIYPLQDTLVFLTDEFFKFRGDTSTYWALTPALNYSQFILRMNIPPYGYFQYNEESNQPGLPDSIHAQVGNTNMAHELWMVRL